jgi:transcription initiation factor TFIIB
VEREELASGVAPSGVAAATIYIAATKCNKPVTQKEVAEVAGVTEVTIRNRYKQIAEAMGITKPQAVR